MNAQSSPQLVAVMPVYNEEENIEAVVSEWMARFEQVCPSFKLITLNDGSRDKTASVLDQLATRFGERLQVVHKTNSGHGRTCRTGYELALDAGAEWVFQLDSDGQCDPSYFQAFWSARQQRDCVFGFRRSRDDGFGRLVISRTCRLLVWAVTGAYMLDPNVPYRLMRARILRESLESVPADFDIHNIAVSYALTKQDGSRWKNIPIHFRARQGGENSINVRKIAAMGLNMLRDFSRIRTPEAAASALAAVPAAHPAAVAQ